jgi:hypothetical protein
MGIGLKVHKRVPWDSFRSRRKFNLKDWFARNRIVTYCDLEIYCISHHIDAPSRHHVDAADLPYPVEKQSLDLVEKQSLDLVEKIAEVKKNVVTEVKKNDSNKRNKKKVKKNSITIK